MAELAHLANRTGSGEPAFPSARIWFGRATQAFVPLLMATLPLEFTSQWFPIHLLQVSRIVIMAGFILFAIQLVVQRGRIEVPRNASFVGLIVLAAYATLSALVTRSHDLGSIATLVVYALVLLMVYNWTRTWEDQWRAFAALALSGMVIAALGIILYFTDTAIWRPDTISPFHRVSATFADPNIFARFLALVAASSLVLFADRGRGLWRLVLLGTPPLATIAIAFTFSRFGWIIFFLSIVLTAILARRQASALAAACAMPLVFAAVLILNPAVLMRSGQFIVHTLPPQHPIPFFGFVYHLPLDPERRYLIAGGLQMFLDHPIVGLGFGNYQHALRTTYQAFLEPGFADTLSHTSLVTILAELGLVGFALTLFVVAAIGIEASHALRLPRPQRAFVVAALVPLAAIFLDSQVTGRLFTEPYLWVFLGLLYAAGAGMAQPLPAAAKVGAERPRRG